MSSRVPSQDRALVLSARRGDRGAREELAGRIARQAYVFGLQITRDADAARDIAQDSVLRFFTSLGRFDADRAIEPWLYQIVRNRARDLARRNRLRRSDSLDQWIDERHLQLADERIDPVAESERRELQRRIWNAVAELSEAHREIFILRDHHDLTYKEIADVLTIPVGTVMSRLHAARKHLRVLLDERSES